MNTAKLILQNGIIVFDATTVSAKTDKIHAVKHVVEQQPTKIVELVELWYEGCISPMVVDMEEYEDLINGKIVELHKGEVFILFK
jgi:hypothetical protein